MARRPPDPLRRRGCLHPHAGQVTDELFADHEFFDPRDLVQVKYEMLRRVRVDGDAVSRSAARFGLSRPAYYQARQAYEAGGLPALLPRKPGPRGAHKLSAAVLQAVRAARAVDPALRAPQLAQLVRERFGVTVHPRSIERVLSRPEKKRPG